MSINGAHNLVVRTHDEFYAREDPQAPPKESFIAVGTLIDAYKKENSISIIDFGCASGSFVNYLTSRFPQDRIVGFEVLRSLVEAGRVNYPNIRIEQASILERNTIPGSSVDVFTLLGILSIFDDVEPILLNLAHWVKPGGKVFIHGMFNPLDVDVFVKYRNSADYETDAYESGWNIVSQSTISKLLWANGAKNVKFHKFDIQVDLERNLNDPLRSWTEKLENGTRQILNGTCLKQPQYILEADF